MVTVTVWRDTAGRIHGFRSEGHAGYADAGEDIVCAAVSALTQSAVLGLAQHLRMRLDVEQRPGWLQCILCDDVDTRSAGGAAVLETMVLGLENIAQQYPQQLRVREHVAQFAERRRGQWPS